MNYPVDALRTLGDWLRWSVSCFERAQLSYGHGTLNARDEAAWLILHALGLPLDELTPNLQCPLTAAQGRRVRVLIERRVRTRKPAAYLMREAWLGDFSFYVDERVIVPRSYVAEMLREDLAPWIMRPPAIRSALDLCTGSGCLAILIAHSFPRAKIDAADIATGALAVARRNIATYQLQRRIRVVKSDLFRQLPGSRYDLIISNPPYVDALSMRRLPLEYRAEPTLALAGGSDGLDLVRIILSEAAAHLNPGGLLIVEVGHNRKRVERAFPRLPFAWPLTSGGDDCVFVLTREQLVQALQEPPAAPSRPRRAVRRSVRA